MNQDKSFMDSRTWIAVLIVTLIWVGWQSYLSKKYQTDGSAPTTAVTTTLLPQPTAVAAGAQQVVAPAETPKQVETYLAFEDDVWSFKVSSLGMGIQDVVLKKYKDRDGNLIVLANSASERAFETRLLGSDQPLNFEMVRDGNSLVGRASFGSTVIEKTVRVDSVHYTYDVELRVSGTPIGGIRTVFADTIPESHSSFFAPAVDGHSMYVAHGTTYLRETLSHTGAGPIKEKVDNVSVASIGALYFTQALVDSSDILPKFEGYYRPGQEGKVVAVGEVQYAFPNGVSDAVLKFKGFVGPKDLGLLKSIDERLEKVVDYWILGSIAKPMLKLMKWLHAMLGNWGLAIIFLTLIVRILVLPLYLSSFRSMKAMQRVQPQMKALKEKYKNDPQQMNQQVMKLFKDNKVNPLGGCLPMLLQFPIFIALYRVLSQSIELYQVPFIFWIKDLSIKDPYFVLPVLMGVSMFVQQKITPTATTDPAQQKILMFMPVIFSFMMLTLPSGLTLYIFVSTLFGIAQQFVFMRDKTPTTVVAKA